LIQAILDIWERAQWPDLVELLLIGAVVTAIMIEGVA